MWSHSLCTGTLLHKPPSRPPGTRLGHHFQRGRALLVPTALHLLTAVGDAGRHERAEHVVLAKAGERGFFVFRFHFFFNFLMTQRLVLNQITLLFEIEDVHSVKRVQTFFT